MTGPGLFAFPKERTTVEEGIDYEAIIAKLDADGGLEIEGIVDTLLVLYEFLEAADIGADHPSTYRTIIAAMTWLVNFRAEYECEEEMAIEVLGRLATRALRDLTHHG